MTEETLDLAPLDKLLEWTSKEESGLIPILQQAQEIYGYPPKEILVHIAKQLSLPPSQVSGVATFYAQFHLQPRGRHIIQECNSTACHVRGARKIISEVESELGIIVDGNVVGRLVPATMLKIIGELS